VKKITFTFFEVKPETERVHFVDEKVAALRKLNHSLKNWSVVINQILFTENYSRLSPGKKCPQRKNGEGSK